MKNIQTGNPIAIFNIDDTITIYSEIWEQDTAKHLVIAQTKITGRVDGSPCDCDFSYQAICLATPKNGSTYVVGSVDDHACIDDALSELEDCLKENGIKWYAPQTLGV